MRRSLPLWLGLVLSAPVRADDLAALLARPILEEGTALREVQAFAEARVAPMPEVATREDWEARARAIRSRILEEIVFRGEARRWREHRGETVWLEAMPGGPGYRLRKLRFEPLPGLWIPAILYEPHGLEGKVPGVLNVNGHDGAGKAAPYKQIRSINQAKRGMVALNVEWLGMGQLRGEGYVHYRMNQLDLAGTSGLAPFYLLLERALDVLLAHPHVDPDRVAVAGLSGGGWQTIFLSALDERVRLANPVAGYSSFRTRARHVSDLGDSEQTPRDLAAIADYTHLTALLAPRPALLTYNAKDDCCFRADHALPPLLEAARPIYALYGAEANLRSHVNEDPGTHNFERENREALYRFLGEHFFSADPGYSAGEIPCASEVKSPEELAVPLPEPNATFQSLALALARDLPRERGFPKSREAADSWRAAKLEALGRAVRFRRAAIRAEKVGESEAEKVGESEAGKTRAVFWRLRAGRDWTVPAVELARGEPERTALLVADEGRARAAEEASRLLESGLRVVAADPFYWGESRIPERDFLYALLVSSAGERPLGIQAGEIAAAARWLAAERGLGPVRVVAQGPRASLAALVAAALEPAAIGGLELGRSLASLREVIERNLSAEEAPELFPFGLLEVADIRELVGLVAPRPVRFAGGDAELSERLRAELAGIADWHELLGSRGDPFD